MATNKTNKETLIPGVTYGVEEIVKDSELELGFYDPLQTQIDLDGLASMSKDVKKSAARMSDRELRFALDYYDQIQQRRIGIANQLRAVNQGYDESTEENISVTEWLFLNDKNTENQAKKAIEYYVRNNPVCKWASQVKGVGPIYAAKLWDAIDMSKCHHANQFLSYLGLNDNNTPWLGAEKSKKLVNEAYEKFGLKSSDEITDDVFLFVAEASGRNVDTVKNGFNRHKEKDTRKSSDKSILTKYMSMPPYNTKMKPICYLIGKSFQLNCNRGSKYGRLYSERKALETMKNDNLEYKEQAERLLAENNYDKNTDTYKCLIQGKLSPAHIDQRAKRYATKIFITHFFEAAWIYTHQTKPPVPYVIEHMDHVDYIEPEVPYDELWK